MPPAAVAPDALVLFDLDGTLLDPAGAGRAALADAFRAVHGVEVPRDGFSAAGRVDVELFAALAASLGVAPDLPRLAAAYLTALPGRLSAAPGRVLPGVRPLLAALRRRPRVRLGLQTGNLRAAAELKLRHFGLWDALARGGAVCGGFAEDGPERARVVARAIERAGGPFSRVAVVGDAPQDVAAARANGAFALAVGTGYCAPEALRAARPDAWMDDLADTRAALSLLLGHP
jgi:phosphoglycolate phosphatase